MKKIILTLLLLSIAVPSAWAKEVPVKIKPVQKITTSNFSLQEGDSLDFVISENVLINSKLQLKKGTQVQGIITELEDNDYIIKPAKLYIENFRTTTENGMPVKLKGIIYKSGNEHQVFGEFLIFDLLRGGEVQIKPEKDEFTLYAEDNL